MEQKTQKFETEKSFKEKLKLYLFLVRPLMHGPPKDKEFMTAIVDFRVEDAIKQASKIHSSKDPSMGILYTGNFVDMEWLLDKLKEGGIKEVSDVTQERAVKTIQTFKAGLLMASEEFVTNEQDKVELKRIINTIKDVFKNN